LHTKRERGREVSKGSLLRVKIREPEKKKKGKSDDQKKTREERGKEEEEDHR